MRYGMQCAWAPLSLMASRMAGLGVVTLCIRMCGFRVGAQCPLLGGQLQMLNGPSPQ
jgi:hypothetical protein